MNKKMINIGKQISYILRHNPDPLEMDGNGWIDVNHLLRHIKIEKPDLDYIVENNNKKRYSYNEDESKIRANQGHSIDVDIELEECKPPDILYHGSGRKYGHLIIKQGIKKMNRQYVHLSADQNVAIDVGKRHGKHMVYWIDAKRMYNDGIKFYLSKNGVWLTEYIAVTYIKNVMM